MAILHSEQELPLNPQVVALCSGRKESRGFRQRRPGSCWGETPLPWATGACSPPFCWRDMSTVVQGCSHPQLCGHEDTRPRVFLLVILPRQGIESPVLMAHVTLVTLPGFQNSDPLSCFSYRRQKKETLGLGARWCGPRADVSLGGDSPPGTPLQTWARRAQALEWRSLLQAACFCSSPQGFLEQGSESPSAGDVLGCHPEQDSALLRESQAVHQGHSDWFRGQDSLTGLPQLQN